MTSKRLDEIRKQADLWRVASKHRMYGKTSEEVFRVNEMWAKDVDELLGWARSSGLYLEAETGGLFSNGVPVLTVDDLISERRRYSQHIADQLGPLGFFPVAPDGEGYESGMCPEELEAWMLGMIQKLHEETVSPRQETHRSVLGIEHRPK